MWIILTLYMSTVFAQDDSCSAASSLQFTPWLGYGWYVTYTYQCNGINVISRPFCDGSGWGNEEATVACREYGEYNYGVGRLVQVSAVEYGVRHIECNGSEHRLSECEIGRVIYNQRCDYVASVTQCSNVPQVYVKDVINSPRFPNHLTGKEGQNVWVCLEIVDTSTLSEVLYFTLTTAASTNGIEFESATEYSDYVLLNETVVFELSSMMMSERCVEIEIVADTLTEPWEVFTVLISTTSSAVEIVNPMIDVYIRPNTGLPSSSSWSTKIRPSSTSGALIRSHTTSLTPIILDVSHSSSIRYPTIYSNGIRTSSTPASSKPTSKSMGNSKSGLIAGVTASIVVLLLALPVSLVLVILWFRRKSKHLFTKSTPPTQVSSTSGDYELDDKSLSLSNPTYQPTTCIIPQPGVEQRASDYPEHNFKNPLYSASGEVVVVSGSTESTSVAPQETVYECVETGFTGE